MSFAMYFALFQPPPDIPPLPPASCCIWPLVLLVLACIALVSSKKAKKRRKAEQKLADQIAQRLQLENELRINHALLGISDYRFALYLRPFTIDKKIRVRSISSSRLPHIRIIHWLLRDRVNYDYQLKEEFEALVGITLLSFDGSDNPGAAHLRSTHVKWFEDFRRLAPRAEAIVIVPGIDRGILDEVRWLKSNDLLDNAIFLKPKGYPKRRWEELKRQYEVEGFHGVPGYSFKEISFRIDATGRCFEECPWPRRYTINGFERAVVKRRRLLLHRPLDGSNDSGLAPLPDDVISSPWSPTIISTLIYLLTVALFFVIMALVIVIVLLGGEHTWDTVVILVAVLGLVLSAAASAVIATVGVCKGRQYGKWIAVIWLLLGFAFWVIALIAALNDPGDFQETLRSAPVLTRIIMLIPSLTLGFLLVRMLFSKQINKFFGKPLAG